MAGLSEDRNTHTVSLQWLQLSAWRGTNTLLFFELLSKVKG